MKLKISITVVLLLVVQVAFVLASYRRIVLANTILHTWDAAAAVPSEIDARYIPPQSVGLPMTPERYYVAIDFYKKKVDALRGGKDTQALLYCQSLLYFLTEGHRVGIVECSTATQRDKLLGARGRHAL